jgi:hypothetical protein
LFQREDDSGIHPEATNVGSAITGTHKHKSSPYSESENLSTESQLDPDVVGPDVDDRRKAEIAANHIASAMRLINVNRAQAQFRFRVAVDENGDGKGENGSLEELAGKALLRGSNQTLDPPVLGIGTFSSFNRDGTAMHQGYIYRLYLPRSGGMAVAEDFAGSLPIGLVHPVLAEKRFVLYAWPAKHGLTGRRTFVQTETGRPLWTDAEIYSGDSGPEPDAAFVPVAGMSGGITGDLAVDAVGRDGNTWVRLE